MNNLRFPAEWEPQAGILLTWPHQGTDWNNILEEAHQTYLMIASSILQHEKLLICAHNENLSNRLQRELMELAPDNIHHLKIYVAPCDDTWTRDHGPITILKRQNECEVATLLDFNFNAWGGKFPCQLDNEINRRLHKMDAFGHTPIVSPGITLEGGALESDGQGTLMTTSHCVLSASRNQDMSKNKFLTLARKHLGINRILWLDHGDLEGDDTDGHIDTLARFCNADTIAYVQCTRRDDIHYAGLQAMENQLRQFRRSDGSPYSLVPIPLPSPIFDEGRRLPATYANFLIINGAVLFPVYRVKEDALALQQIQRCFKNRKIIPVDCCSLIKQNGSLHCVTMQLSAALNL